MCIIVLRTKEPFWSILRMWLESRSRTLTRWHPTSEEESTKNSASWWAWQCLVLMFQHGWGNWQKVSNSALMGKPLNTAISVRRCRKAWPEGRSIGRGPWPPSPIPRWHPVTRTSLRRFRPSAWTHFTNLGERIIDQKAEILQLLNHIVNHTYYITFTVRYLVFFRTFDDPLCFSPQSFPLHKCLTAWKRWVKSLASSFWDAHPQVPVAKAVAKASIWMVAFPSGSLYLVQLNFHRPKWWLAFPRSTFSRVFHP